MRLNKEARKLSRKMFRSSMVNGRLDRHRALTWVREIARAKPRNYTHALKNFARLIRLEEKRNQAVVESAVELTPAERNKVQSDVHARFGEQVQITYAVNPDLLGGLRIQVGSDVWDGSVRDRLARLQNQI